MSTIQFQNLSFRYPSMPHALWQSLNLTIAPGKLTMLLGPNGCGKSTLLKLASGFLQPQRGEVLLNGKPLHAISHRQRRKMLSVMTQNLELALDFSVRELIDLGRCDNTLFPSDAPGKNATAQRLTEALLQELDLQALANAPVNRLSGGERQRALLASAFSGAATGQPQGTLLLDEPTSALDPGHTKMVMQAIQRRVDQGLTVWMVTHNLDLASQYADQVILTGKAPAGIIATGAPETALTEDTLEAAYGIRPHRLGGDIVSGKTTWFFRF